jgi:hypothetical protein
LSYHDEDGVYTTSADGGGDQLHHIILAQMDVHVRRRRQDDTVGIFEMHLVRIKTVDIRIRGYWYNQMLLTIC